MQDHASPPPNSPANAHPAQAESEKKPAAKPPVPSPLRRFAPALVVLALCALLGGGGYYVWQTWFSKNQNSGELLTAVATRGNLEDTVTATGTLQPKDFVDVGTQVSGQLKRLLVDIGAVVKARDLLAEIDPSVYQAKVDGDRALLRNQQAQQADRQAQLVLAELQLKRQQNLAKEEATSADALQSAEAAQKSAVAQVNVVKAQIQQTESTLRGDEANLGYTKIYAPISGTVVSQAAKLGQTLNANQSAPIVMRIADLSTMTVQAQVSEADVPKLRIGMDVYFTTLGGDNRRYYGKLRQIPPTPTVVNNVVLYDALFDVANPHQTLMTQMTAQVFFVASSARDAVLVPLTALRPVAREGGRQRGQRGSRGTDDKEAAAAKEEAGKAAADQAGTAPADKEVKNPAVDKDGGKSAEERRGSRRDRADRAPGEGRKGDAERAPGTARSGGAERAPGTGRKGGGERAAGNDPRSQFANGRALVSVVDEDGKVTEREVRVGVMNRVSAQIISGLEPGEKVVIGVKTSAAPRAQPAKSSLVPTSPQGQGRGRQ